MSKTTRNQIESKTKRSDKDLWTTSDLAFSDAMNLMGIRYFDIDVAASARNARCPHFITEEQNALNPSTAWHISDNGLAMPTNVWCNPPFSLKRKFLNRAYHEATQGWGVTICMMIPYEPTTGWWRDYVHNRATFVYVPDGRYNYNHPETGEIMRGVPFPSAFAVFTSFQTETNYIHFTRGVPRRWSVPC